MFPTSHWPKSYCIETNYNIWTVYQWHLLSQFSIAYDIYLSLHREVDKKSRKHLIDNMVTDDSCIHAWCVCTNSRMSQKLIFDLLWVMNGDDSLKWRIWHALKGEGGEPGPPIEWIGTRSTGKDIYISLEYMNEWAHEMVNQQLLPAKGVHLFWLNTWYRSWDTKPTQSDGRTRLRRLQTGCGEYLMKLACLRCSVSMGFPNHHRYVWYGVLNSKFYLITSLDSADHC